MIGVDAASLHADESERDARQHTEQTLGIKRTSTLDKFASEHKQRFEQTHSVDTDTSRCLQAQRVSWMQEQ